MKFFQVFEESLKRSKNGQKVVEKSTVECACKIGRFGHFGVIFGPTLKPLGRPQKGQKCHFLVKNDEIHILQLFFSFCISVVICRAQIQNNVIYL